MYKNLSISVLYIIAILYSNMATNYSFNSLITQATTLDFVYIGIIVAVFVICAFQYTTTVKVDYKNILFLLCVYIITVTVTTLLMGFNSATLLLNLAFCLIACRYYNVRNNDMAELGLAQLWAFIGYSILIFYMFINVIPLLSSLVFLMFMLNTTLTSEVKLKDSNLANIIFKETTYFLIGIIVLTSFDLLIGSNL